MIAAMMIVINFLFCIFSSIVSDTIFTLSLSLLHHLTDARSSMCGWIQLCSYEFMLSPMTKPKLNAALAGIIVRCNIPPQNSSCVFSSACGDIQATTYL